MGFITDKQYMLDTNVFRYKTDNSSQYLRQAKLFWKMILKELRDGEAEIYTSAEVIRELEVQAYTMFEKQKKKLEVLKNHLTVVSDDTSIEAEHLIRKMSAYIRSKYKDDLNVIGRGVEYPAVSDSRILLSAWQNECILVTANIKEFMLYPLLFDDYECKLYDLITGSYIEIAGIVHEMINEDAVFMTMKYELKELYGY